MRTISSESKGWIPIETNIHPKYDEEEQ